MQNIIIPNPSTFIKNIAGDQQEYSKEEVVELLSLYAAEIFVEVRDKILLEIVCNASKYTYIERGMVMFNQEEIDKLNNKK